MEATNDAGGLRARLRNVYWIGGGSAAGKSAVARRIADRNGLQVYSTDAVMPGHARRLTAEDAPHLERFKAIGMDERWLDRSPQTMLETFHWFKGEGFDLIVEDLLQLSAEVDVVAEGFRLLPNLVKPLLVDQKQAIWLLPTPEFRQAVFDGRRGTAGDFLSKTSDPERARRNLLERDRMFTERLAKETARLELAAIEVDGALGEKESADKVAQTFGL